MSVYIIANQYQHYLGKQAQWLEAGDIAHIFRTPHYDVALNQLIEVNARDIEQRLSLLECPLDEKSQPLLTETTPARKKAVAFDEPEAAAKDDGQDAEQETGDNANENENENENESITSEHDASVDMTSDNIPE